MCYMKVKHIMFMKLLLWILRTSKMDLTFQSIQHNHVLETKRKWARDHLNSTVAGVIITCAFQMKTLQNCLNFVTQKVNPALLKVRPGANFISIYMYVWCSVFILNENFLKQHIYNSSGCITSCPNKWN